MKGKLQALVRSWQSLICGLMWKQADKMTTVGDQREALQDSGSRGALEISDSGRYLLAQMQGCAGAGG